MREGLLSIHTHLWREGGRGENPYIIREGGFLLCIHPPGKPCIVVVTTPPQPPSLCKLYTPEHVRVHVCWVLFCPVTPGSPPYQPTISQRTGHFRPTRSTSTNCPTWIILRLLDSTPTQTLPVRSRKHGWYTATECLELQWEVFYSCSGHSEINLMSSN